MDAPRIAKEDFHKIESPLTSGLGEKLSLFPEIFTALKLDKIYKVKTLEWIWRLFESSEVIGRHLHELVLMSND